MNCSPAPPSPNRPVGFGTGCGPALGQEGLQAGVLAPTRAVEGQFRAGNLLDLPGPSGPIPAATPGSHPGSGGSRTPAQERTDPSKAPAGQEQQSSLCAGPVMGHAANVGSFRHRRCCCVPAVLQGTPRSHSCCARHSYRGHCRPPPLVRGHIGDTADPQPLHRRLTGDTADPQSLTRRLTEDTADPHP